jgi:AcrR family transcriptional regulator
MNMREKIKSVAQDLLIERGYSGVSFGDIAKQLGTTRANIHYHFGNKSALVTEVLVEYVDYTLLDLGALWRCEGKTLFEKIQATVDYSHKRWAKHNTAGEGGKPWSLISRMRQDSYALTEEGRGALGRFRTEFYATITSAVEGAKQRGELIQSAPVDDIALQLVSIASSAGPITQDAGTFEPLEHLYMAFGRIVTNAYGVDVRRKGNTKVLGAR